MKEKKLRAKTRRQEEREKLAVLKEYSREELAQHLEEAKNEFPGAAIVYADKYGNFKAEPVEGGYEFETGIGETAVTAEVDADDVEDQISETLEELAEQPEKKSSKPKKKK